MKICTIGIALTYTFAIANNTSPEAQFSYIVMSNCVVFIANQDMKVISSINKFILIKLNLLSVIGDK